MVSNASGLLTMLKRGVLRRGPVCSRGRIFRSFLRLRRNVETGEAGRADYEEGAFERFERFCGATTARSRMFSAMLRYSAER